MVTSLALIVSVFFASPAKAANPAYISAERHGAHARLAELAGKHDAAGASYEKAYQALPNPDYLFRALTVYQKGSNWDGAARVCTTLLQRPLRPALQAQAERGLKDAVAQLDGDRTRLAVNVTPPGARVTVNGEEIPYGTPAIAWLPPGTHEVRVEHPGHDTVQQSVTTNLLNPTSIDVVLQSNTEGMGELRVMANVGGASVYVEDTLVGEAPVRGVLRAAGTYEMRVIRDGFDPWQRTVEVVPNRPTEINAMLSRSRPMAIAPPLAPAASPKPLPEPEYATPAPAPLQYADPEPVADSTDYAEPAPMTYSGNASAVASESSGGGGAMGVIGWSLLGTGLAVAGGGGAMTYLKMDSDTQRDELLATYNAGLEWCATGDCSAGGQIPELVGWETSTETELYELWFLPQDQDFQKVSDSFELYSYILYGTGGALVLTGAALLIIDGMEDGGSEPQYGQTQPEWRWSGVTGSFGPKGSMFTTGLSF